MCCSASLHLQLVAAGSGDAHHTLKHILKQWPDMYHSAGLHMRQAAPAWRLEALCVLLDASAAALEPVHASQSCTAGLRI